MKTCAKCKTDKPKSAFAKGNGKDGLYSWCRLCQSEYARNYRSTRRGQAARQRARSKYAATPGGRAAINARATVMRAIIAGDLPRAADVACADCGQPAREYHHEDYARENWLVVIPLCKADHIARHSS